MPSYEESIMNIAGLDKAEVLQVLYNRARTPDVPVAASVDGNMSIEDARERIRAGGYDFDYVRQRLLKIDITEDNVETFHYNREYGENAAENIVDTIRS